MPVRPLLLVALLATGLAEPAAANVYKCTINGQIRYQDAPCPGTDGAKPHLEIKPGPAPAPEPAAAPVASNDPAPSASSSPAQAGPERGSEGGEATPAQLRAAFEARAAAQASAPPPPPAAEGPPDRLNDLQNQITESQRAHRQLVSEQREASQRILEQFAGRETSEEAVAALRESDYQYRQRRLAAADRERALHAEIRRLCPNGTLSTRGRLECR